MILDHKEQEQLTQILATLKNEIIIQACLGNDENSHYVKIFLDELAKRSSKISIEAAILPRTPAFCLSRKGQKARITFAGLPFGREFPSFLRALQEVDSIEPLSKGRMAKRLKEIEVPLHFETYVSLTCKNCSVIVQELNELALLHSKISHTMIESKAFVQERFEKNIFSVPTVLLNGEVISSGRKSGEEILDIALGRFSIEAFQSKGTFDLLIVGGGPAGCSAAIFAARKKLSVGLLAETMGGKLQDIASIENMIGYPFIKGTQLMDEIDIHIGQYAIDQMKNQRVIQLIKEDQLIKVRLANGAILKAKAVVLAVGASWNKLNIAGEAELFNRGVAHCSHCDGPLFENKKVAVIGSKNQAVQGAIELANYAKHVFVLTHSDNVKADKILVEHLLSLKNVTVITRANVREICGREHVEGLVYKQGILNKTEFLSLDGVFVQIGFAPDTKWLINSRINLNHKGEICVDERGMTNIEGIFAAGDCTNLPYKQIVLAMAAGCTAALSAHSYLLHQ
ncbi:alkyl hydroperoxide reductase subunit F [Enterococcus casseliflavus]|nr:alkyl hydroperoxide reductase subunit F [Enterococcus casseliflavus]